MDPFQKIVSSLSFIGITDPKAYFGIGSEGPYLIDIDKQAEMGEFLATSSLSSSTSFNPVLSVIISNGYSTTAVSFENLTKAYLDEFFDRVTPVMSMAVNNLLRNRDYLGLQLNFEFGNIPEPQFLEEEKQYLVPAGSHDTTDLVNQAKLLSRVTRRVYNEDELSVIMNCSLEDAAKTLEEMIS